MKISDKFERWLIKHDNDVFFCFTVFVALIIVLALGDTVYHSL
jgi:hypothetical protein